MVSQPYEYSLQRLIQYPIYLYIQFYLTCFKFIDQGNIIEFDSPHNLITNHESLFYKMCQNSGEFGQLMSLALKKGNKDV